MVRHLSLIGGAGTGSISVCSGGFCSLSVRLLVSKTNSNCTATSPHTTAPHSRAPPLPSPACRRHEPEPSTAARSRAPRPAAELELEQACPLATATRRQRRAGAGVRHSKADLGRKAPGQSRGAAPPSQGRAPAALLLHVPATTAPPPHGHNRSSLLLISC